MYLIFSQVRNRKHTDESVGRTWGELSALCQPGLLCADPWMFKALSGITKEFMWGHNAKEENSDYRCLCFIMHVYYSSYKEWGME